LKIEIYVVNKRHVYDCWPDPTSGLIDSYKQQMMLALEDEQRVKHRTSTLNPQPEPLTP